jgi:hypothetical protein
MRESPLGSGGALIVPPRFSASWFEPLFHEAVFTAWVPGQEDSP